MKRFVNCLLLLLCAACQRPSVGEELVLIHIQDRNGITETISAPERLAHYSQTNFSNEQPYKQVLRTFKKEGEHRSVITSYHPNGSLWKKLDAREMRSFGAYREWFPNGQMRIAAEVIGGTADLSEGAQATWLFDGVASVWDESGNLLAEISYDKGALSGVSRYYFPQGALEREVPYTRDKIDGMVRSFWKEGPLKETSAYVQGILQTSSSYSLDGQVLAKEEYREGKLWFGEYRDRTGKLLAQVEEGEGVSALFEGELLKELQQIQQGKVHGLVQRFQKDKIKGFYHIKNGQKQGEELEYFYAISDSNVLRPKISIMWDQGKIHGVTKTWFENGQLESQREWCRNQRSGPACAWYRDGTLMLIEEYENDHLIKGNYYQKRNSEPVSTIYQGQGWATLYDEEGSFLHKVKYVNGLPAETE